VFGHVLFNVISIVSCPAVGRYVRTVLHVICGEVSAHHGLSEGGLLLAIEHLGALANALDRGAHLHLAHLDLFQPIFLHIKCICGYLYYYDELVTNLLETILCRTVATTLIECGERCLILDAKCPFYGDLFNHDSVSFILQFL